MSGQRKARPRQTHTPTPAHTHMGGKRVNNFADYAAGFPGEAQSPSLGYGIIIVCKTSTMMTMMMSLISSSNMSAWLPLQAFPHTHTHTQAGLNFTQSRLTLTQTDRHLLLSLLLFFCRQPNKIFSWCSLTSLQTLTRSWQQLLSLSSSHGWLCGLFMRLSDICGRCRSTRLANNEHTQKHT